MRADTFSALFPWFFLAAVLAGLLAFGFWFDRYVTRAEAAGHDEGYTWLYVVIGCAVTVLATGLIDLFFDWNAGLTSLLCFAASGTPMIFGAIRRHQALRLRYLRLIKNNAVTDGRLTEKASQ